MKFRPVRGGLAESMAEVQEWNTPYELESIVFELTREMEDLLVHGTPIKLRPYGNGPDMRIGWEQTYLVTVEGIGPIGYTDGPLPS